MNKTKPIDVDNIISRLLSLRNQKPGSEIKLLESEYNKFFTLIIFLTINQNKISMHKNSTNTLLTTSVARNQFSSQNLR